MTEVLYRAEWAIVFFAVAAVLFCLAHWIANR